MEEVKLLEKSAIQRNNKKVIEYEEVALDVDEEVHGWLDDVQLVWSDDEDVEEQKNGRRPCRRTHIAHFLKHVTPDGEQDKFAVGAALTLFMLVIIFIVVSL